MSARVRFGLTAKFVVLATAVVAFSSALWGWWAWSNEKRLLYEQLERTSRVMMTTLSTPIINALLYEEMGVIAEGGLLDNFVEEIMNNKDFPAVYASVTDDSGKILAHNRYREYGKTYTDPLTTSSLSTLTYRTQYVADKDTGIQMLDLAMPLKIYGKSWGCLRVGVSTEPLRQQLAALQRRIISFCLAFFLVGTAAFYAIGKRLAQPLRKLSASMADISLADPQPAPPTRRSDEIGMLQQSFYDMVNRLSRSEKERANAVERLIQSERLASIGKIVTGVAHEVNNPLAAITATIHNLEEKAPDDLRKYTDILKAGAERIETIVRQLMDFTRAASLELIPVASEVFFVEAEQFGRVALKKHSITFTAHNDAPATTIIMDRAKMHQVVLNLLMNAADASRSEGVVNLLMYVHEGEFSILVTNEGKDIPPGDLERLFDLFFTTKAPGKGTGMGLAICKSIVDQHRGSILVESKNGRTMFIVKIPLNGPAA